MLANVAVFAAPINGPAPVCGAQLFPGYPDVDAAPVVKFWNHGELGSHWTAPECTGWTGEGFSTLLVVAGRFRGTGVAERVAAIRGRGGIRYWSTTQKRWKTLIAGASALTEPSPGKRRTDFSFRDLSEGLSQGKPLFFEQEDNLTGKAVYRFRVLSASPDRIAFETENVTTMRYLLLPVFHPGEMQSIYFFEREGNDVWRYFSMVRTGEKASSLAAGHEASSINRAVAFYRYYAGVPTDREPPAAR